MKISFERMFSKGNKQKSRDHGTANMANLKVEESKRERVLREMHEESGNYPDVSAYNIEWRRRREAQPIAEDYEGAIALVEELQEAARNEPALKAALYKLGIYKKRQTKKLEKYRQVFLSRLIPLILMGKKVEFWKIWVGRGLLLSKKA